MIIFLYSDWISFSLWVHPAEVPPVVCPEVGRRDGPALGGQLQRAALVEGAHLPVAAGGVKAAELDGLHVVDLN